MTGSHRSATAPVATGPAHRTPETPRRRIALVILALVVAAAAVLITYLLKHDSGSTTKSSAGATGSNSAPLSASATPSITSAATSASPAAAVPVSSTAKAVVPAPAASAPAGPITYTVKPGDNLTIIAAWFKMHGYGSLYDANKAVLGSNPDLIHPGQVITIASSGMTVG